MTDIPGTVQPQIRTRLAPPLVFFIAAALGLFTMMFATYQLGGEDVRMFQADSDQLVTQSIETAQHEGPMFLAGFMQTTTPVHMRALAAVDPSKVNDAYIPYLSQYGLIYKAAWLFAPTEPSALASYFMRLRLVFMAATALVLALLAFGVEAEFGTAIGTIVALELAVSPWLLQFSKSLYWAPFLMLLPFAIMFTFYSRCVTRRHKALLYSAFGAALLIKFLTGYEYITCVAGSAAPAILYHEMKNGGGWRLAVRPILLAAGISIAAFLVAIAFHYGQALAYFGDSARALKAILLPAQYNAGAHADITQSVMTTGGLLSVAKIYFKQSALLFLSLGSVIVIGGIVTTISFFARPRRAWPQADAAIWEAKIRALIAATAAGALASISWVVQLRHIFAHAHIDAIIFYLPFLPMLYTLTAAILVWLLGTRDAAA